MENFSKPKTTVKLFINVALDLRAFVYQRDTEGAPRQATAERNLWHGILFKQLECIMTSSLEGKDKSRG